MFKNENTRARRAWIESAISSVRAHLAVSGSDVPPVEALGNEPSAIPSVVAEPQLTYRPDGGRRPHLYVAWSDGERRSGT